MALAGTAAVLAQTADNVLVVVNQADSLSRRIGDYYVHRRAVPLANVCRIRVEAMEDLASFEVYQRQVERPVARCLAAAGLAEKVLYIAIAGAIPLRILGPGEGPRSESASVDSELTLLYAKMKGVSFPRAGGVPNPLFGRRTGKFGHPAFPIYLVTRLAAYDFAEARAMIDRSLQARNRGKFVLDLKSSDSGPGNDWLREAARLLPRDRVVLDETDQVIYDQANVIGYAGWGSNDPHRKRRFLGFRWLPGAIATEFVSTDGRTFRRPPDNWTISTWQDKDKPLWFAFSPQTLAADYIHEGASGCSGHVGEPYLSQTPRPEYLLPAYYSGRTLAESYYLAIPTLSWQNIVIGDPLCRIGKP